MPDVLLQTASWIHFNVQRFGNQDSRAELGGLNSFEGFSFVLYQGHERRVGEEESTNPLDVCLRCVADCGALQIAKIMRYLCTLAIKTVLGTRGPIRCKYVFFLETKLLA